MPSKKNPDPYAKIEPLRPLRLGGRAPAYVVELLTAEHTPWFETEDAIEAGLRRGEDNRQRLAWIRDQFGMLSFLERESIELYYFENLNYRDAARVLRVCPSTVYRAVRRALQKLEQAAEEDGFETASRE